MNRSEENRFHIEEEVMGHVERVLEVSGAETKKDPSTVTQEHVEPKPIFEDDHMKEYDIDMFGAELIPIDEEKTVIIKTEGLSSCISVVGFFVTPERKKFCLFSHSPYHLGEELDSELGNPNVAASTQKEIVAVVQAGLNNDKEIRTLEGMLDKHGLQTLPLRILYRRNTADPKLKKLDGVVEMVWKPNSNPTVSFLDMGLNWKNQIISFGDTNKPKDETPFNPVLA